jgi:hypothetical protein
MKKFKVKRANGTEYNVRLLPIEISDKNKELGYTGKVGTSGSWDKAAEIEINGKWYRCTASHTIKDKGEKVQTIMITKYDKELHDALNLPANFRTQTNHIVATSDWHILYKELLAESVAEFENTANKAVFSKVKFGYHTSYKYWNFRWDSELDSGYIEYNSRIKALKEALKYIDTEALKLYQTEVDVDDYSIQYFFEVPAADLEKISKMQLPELAKAAEKKNNHESSIKLENERQENIENGAIYFTCESAPHDEDLSNEILNSPAPNKGLFTINHRISDDLFARIKKYGKYYSAEFLEECDMFFSVPGWRFSVDALTELKKTNRIFVNNVELS